jgi:hypothetical protein
LWRRWTAPSDDRRATKLRELTPDECVDAVDDLVSLATKVVVVAATSRGEALATLADLS